MTLCYQNLEDYEKALEYALIAYELDRNDVHVLSELGVIYGCMEKYEEALSFLLRAEKLDKNDEWINTEIAINLSRSEKVNEGIERPHIHIMVWETTGRHKHFYAIATWDEIYTSTEGRQYRPIRGHLHGRGLASGLNRGRFSGQSRTRQGGAGGQSQQVLQ